MKNVSFADAVARLAGCTSLAREALYLQHGVTQCLLHSIAVAYYCLALARLLGFLRFRREELFRGALFHDYFLYNWHEPDPSHRLHGFHHPRRAQENAARDLGLTPVESSIILRHMFPLTPAPPTCREGLLVCLVDKGCSVYEIFSRHPYPNREIQSAYQKALQKGQRTSGAGAPPPMART